MKREIYTKFVTTLVYSLLCITLCSSCSTTATKPARIKPSASSFSLPKALTPSLGKKTGIWHTGRPNNETVLHQNYANLHTKSLGQRNYTMYRVNHDGSCGFYSFIPIMLDYLLVENRYEAWLASAKDMLFNKAQQIINGNESVKNKYNLLAPSSDDIGLVYAKAASLLDALNRAPESRPLQDEEMETLTHFLRHLVLSREVIIEANKGHQRELAPVIKDIFIGFHKALLDLSLNSSDELLKKYYQKHTDALGSTENKILKASSPQEARNLLNNFLQNIAEEVRKKESLLKKSSVQTNLHSAQEYANSDKPIISEKEPLNEFETIKNWWASPYQLADLGIPLIILFDYHAGHGDGIFSIATDSNRSVHKWPRKKCSANPEIIIHHHDRAYFDYLVQKESYKR